MKIATFKTKLGEKSRSYDIEFWENYGYVSPCLCSTNGSLESLSSNLWENMQDYYAAEFYPEEFTWEFQVGEKKLIPKSKQEIFDALKIGIILT